MANQRLFSAIVVVGQALGVAIGVTALASGVVALASCGGDANPNGCVGHPCIDASVPEIDAARPIDAGFPPIFDGPLLIDAAPPIDAAP